MHKDEFEIDDRLVRSLIDAQMPQFADLALAIVEPWGTDNAVWRLGPELVVRFPRMQWAVNQIELEATWLPRLAPALSLVVPEPVAVGKPAGNYPYPWAVHRWVPGNGSTLELIDDPVAFATDLARVTSELHAFPTAGARAATNRARHIADYDTPTRKAIESAAHLIDADVATDIWEAALDAEQTAKQVWVHADLEGNCIVRDGKLHGLVDWGSACVGDPAVDVQVVWSPLFTAASRSVFLDELDVDDATLARSRGAAVNQACAALPYYLHTYPLIVERSLHKLRTLGVPINDAALAAATQ